MAAATNRVILNLLSAVTMLLEGELTSIHINETCSHDVNINLYIVHAW